MSASDTETPRPEAPAAERVGAPSRAVVLAGLAFAALGVAAVRLGPPGIGRSARPPGNRPVTPLLYVLETGSPIVGPDGALAEALGIETSGGEFTPILPRGTRVPAARTLTFGTATEDQTTMRLHVLRGMSGRVAENRSLGWVLIGDLAIGRGRPTRVAISFRVAGEEVLLAAYDADDRRLLKIQPASPPEPE